MKADTPPVTLTINGKEITVDSGLTILEAARQNDITIPTLCHHPALTNWGGCRLCVVEVDQSPKLTASCVTPVRSGMQVVTDNAAITASRRLTLEFLFSERNHNCMFCPASGACELQQMAYALSMDHLTVSQSFTEFPVDTTSRYMSLDHNRCILCGRCVRACREIAGSHVLGFQNRGTKTLIGFDLLDRRAASTCTDCGVCLQVCPTGAITNRYRTHVAVSGQPAHRISIPSVCAGCGLLCPTQNIIRDNQLIKIEGILGRTAHRPDCGQLCHKGRFEVLKRSSQRLLTPMIKDDQGQWHPCGWEEALQYSADGLKAIAGRNGAEALFGLASGDLSNETLLHFKELMIKGWEAGYVDILNGDYYRNLVSASNNEHFELTMENSWKTLPEADMVLVIGADLKKRHSLLLSVLRCIFMEKKIPVAAIGGKPDSDFFYSHCLSVVDKALPPAIKFISEFSSNGDNREKAEPPLKGERQNILNGIASCYIDAKTPYIIVGECVVHQNTGLNELYGLTRLQKKRLGTEPAVIFLKPACNSEAAFRLKIAAVKDHFHNYSGGIMLLCEEKEAALAPFKKSRKSPEFIVVLSPYFPEALAELAQVVLPNPPWLEEDGTYCGLDGTERVFKPKVLDPPEGVKSNREILNTLGERALVPLAPPTAADIEAKISKLLAATTN